MKPFNTISAIAVAINGPNVDTDQIIPARFLGKARSDQLAGLFHDVRRDGGGVPLPEFPLNQPVYSGAKILVTGINFGCGSSREQAVTALVDNGFSVIVAPSFGDIFFNNCFQNSVLPVRLSLQRVNELRDLLFASPGAHMTVDLQNQSVIGPDGREDHFEIDSFRKDCLLRGVDEISLTLSFEREIAGFEQRQRCEQEWL